MGKPAPFPLRLEPETRARLEAMAEVNGLSLNQQITTLIDSALGIEKPATLLNPALEREMRRVALAVLQEQIAKHNQARTQNRP